MVKVPELEVMSPLTVPVPVQLPPVTASVPPMLPPVRSMLPFPVNVTFPAMLPAPLNVPLVPTCTVLPAASEVSTTKVPALMLVAPV